MTPPLTTAVPPFLHEYVNPAPVAVTLILGVPVPEHTAAGAVGCTVIAGALLTVTAILLAALIPQPFVAVTLNVPLTAVASKSTVTELLLPFIVAPAAE